MRFTIKELGTAYMTRSTTPSEVVREMLGRIERTEATFNCFITVLRESATSQAASSTLRFEQGKPLGPLDGIPVAVKDLFYMQGVRCTAGSKILTGNVAGYDSPVCARLKEAGAVILGTTNMHEFAAGITGENPHYGPVRNPWDIRRMPGGSSSGSAASLAAGLAVAALGTDTAGSVRVPASLCGVVGFKPTYGRVSRLGVVPLSSSFDTVGTLTSCSWDAAALLSTLAGHQAEDLTTVSTDVPDYIAEVDQDVSSFRIGVPRKFFHETIDGGVEEVFNRLIDKLTNSGCTTREIELQGVEKAASCWTPIRLAEATAFHLHWLDTSPESYGEDVRVLLEDGRKVSAVDYVNAQNLRPVLMEQFSRSMSEVDAIAVPSTATTAPLLAEKSVRIDGKQVDVRSALIRLTLPFNVVGFPTVSIPAGLSRGLPVGVQFAATPFEESKLLRLGRLVEKLSPFPAPPSTV